MEVFVGDSTPTGSFELAEPCREYGPVIRHGGFLLQVVSELHRTQRPSTTKLNSMVVIAHPSVLPMMIMMVILSYSKASKFGKS